MSSDNETIACMEAALEKVKADKVTKAEQQAAKEHLDRQGKSSGGTLCCRGNRGRGVSDRRGEGTGGGEEQSPGRGPQAAEAAGCPGGEAEG